MIWFCTSMFTIPHHYFETSKIWNLHFFSVCNYFCEVFQHLENHFLLQWFSACFCGNQHRNFQHVMYNHELLLIVAHMYTKISSHQSFQIFMQLNKGELECPPSAFQNCSECTRKHWFIPWWLKQSFPLRVGTLPPLPQHHLMTSPHLKTRIHKWSKQFYCIILLYMLPNLHRIDRKNLVRANQIDKPHLACLENVNKWHCGQPLQR